MGARTKTRPMTHEERQDLIRAPISINVIGSQGGRAGTGVAETTVTGKLMRRHTPGTYSYNKNIGHQEEM